jgi:hypothetical protein
LRPAPAKSFETMALLAREIAGRGAKISTRSPRHAGPVTWYSEIAPNGVL